MERKVLVCLLLAAVSTSGIRLLFEPFSEFPNKTNSRAECPDKRTCDGNKTCCELRTGKYGCCDMPEAVCCADRIHCCPKATTCDLRRNKCVHYNGFVTNMHKYEDEDDQSEDNGMKQLVASRIICPDIKSYCLDDQTCCLLAGGMYGCCPLPKAICCSDKEHCCPMGTKCDDASGSCLIDNGGGIVPWFGKEASMAVDDDDEVKREDCPDGTSYCMDGQTCCLLSGGKYGCCPYPRATCCSDMMHCCPSEYVCESTGQFCTKDSLSFPSSVKINAMSSSSSSLEVKNVICPDARYCKDDETCCLLGSDEYGCCPYKEAVCCNDNTHCCPHGYICDPSGRACKKGSTSLPWSVKVESMSVKIQRVVCPDPAYYCNDGETCCLLKGGMYGCCPYPKAVCCADLEHCCPEGYTCDPSGLKCNKESSLPSFLKLTAFNSLPLKHNLMCPDKATYCFDYQTCCLMINGKYGCCEYKEAECCNDRLHCCPKGYKCDSTGTMCIKGSMTLASSPKVEATSLSTSLKRIVCPDGKSYCHDNQTCCPLRRGKFGCCIYPSAVCCEDKQHCCPQGYECNTAGQFCTKEFLSTTSSLTMESKIIIRRKNVVCPDGKVTCASDNTCCIMKNLKYGCCPMPAATCCADGEHCCPTGFKCKESSGTCVNGSVSLPSVEKIEGTKIDSHDSGKITIKNMVDDDIIMCDSTSFCQDGQTCCRGPDRTFKCCPVKSASCCKDGVHCCKHWCVPWFDKCIPSAMKHLGYFFINRAMEEPLASLPAKKVNWCDESLTLYCPSGFDCNMNEGSCTEQSSKFSHQGNDLMASSLIEGQESFQGAGHEISKVMNDVMCADNSSCPDETTCCLQLDGHFTCCQFKNAICCKDQSHCCPQGYECDLHEQTCTRVSDDIEENSPWGFHGHTRANSPRDREGMRCSKKQGGLCPLSHKCCDEGEDSFCCIDDESVCCNGYCCPSNQKCGDEKYTCI